METARAIQNKVFDVRVQRAQAVEWLEHAIILVVVATRFVREALIPAGTRKPILVPAAREVLVVRGTPVLLIRAITHLVVPT